MRLDVPLIADLLNTATYGIGSFATGALSSLSPILSIGVPGDSHGGGVNDVLPAPGNISTLKTPRRPPSRMPLPRRADIPTTASRST